MSFIIEKKNLFFNWDLFFIKKLVQHRCLLTTKGVNRSNFNSTLTGTFVSLIRDTLLAIPEKNRTTQKRKQATSHTFLIKFSPQIPDCETGFNVQPE